MARSWVRVALLLLVLGVFISSLVHYGAVDANDQSLSEPRHVLENWDAHTGQDIYLWASVVESTEDTVKIAAGGIHLTIMAAIPPAAPGDTIQVFGVARSNHRIEPTRTIVAPHTGTLYMYTVSLLAVILTITVFFRHWWIDTTQWCFTRRRREDA